MNTAILLEIISVLILFVLSALCSSSETAVFALNPLHIESIKRRNEHCAKLLSDMLSQPTRLLSTILIGNTLVNVAAVNVGLLLARAVFRDNLALAASVSVPVMTMLLLIFGEVAPKRIAMRYPARVAELYAKPLYLSIRLMAPIRSILEKVVSWVQPELHAADKTLTEEEVLTVVEVGEESGVFDAEEKTMVDGIMRLEDIQAADVMTPRVDLVGIDLDDPLDKQIAVVREIQFRHVPVIRDTPDNIIGFLDVPNFLLSEHMEITECMTPPLHVPETMPLHTILQLFQKKGQRLARVVDEYGGTAGIITRGDILEQITEDVEGEYGEEEEDILKLSRDTWLVDGSTSLEVLNHELDLFLEAEGAERIAGWALEHAGRLLRRGDIVTAQGCQVKVLKVRKHRVTSVVLTKLPQPEEAKELP